MTKKDYIAEVRSDMEYMQEVIADDAEWFWWHGERYSLQYAKDTLAELTEELNKVFNDKNYKPWK
jgi:hypothetical protein